MALAFAALGLSPASALALDAEVTADTAAQAYSLRSPFGEPILYRRRITQTLGLGVYNLLESERPGGPQLFVKLRMRFDADFGVESNETQYNRADGDSRFVPGLREAPLDLMYGYVEGRNLLGGWLGFRLGRQYVTDALGWWSFDGGMVRLTAPYVHVEAYGGFEQRGGLPLSTGRFEQNGAWRGDRKAALDGAPDVFPMFQRAKMAPAVGIGLESAGPTWIHGRFDYRKVWNRGVVTTSPFADGTGRLATLDETRTSSERLGYALDATVLDYGGVRGGLVYDLYNTLFSSWYGSIDGYVTQRLTVSAEYDYFKPTFDGDSIFNWFTHSAITTAQLRAAWSVTDRFDVAGSGGVRWWETDEDPDTSTLPNSDRNTGRALSDPETKSAARLRDWLGSANARYRWETGRGGLRGVLETGERGHRKGVDLSGEKYLSSGKYLVEARGSLFDWKDELRPDRSATSFGYVLGAGWRPSPLANMMLEWEHNTNRIVGQRYRVLALVNLLVTK